MKKIKKVLAVLITLAMVMAMSLTAFAEAETSNIPSENDTATAVVSNVESGATVTAYQIVKAKYNEYGFVAYEKVNESLGIENILAPTSDEVSVIAKNTSGLETEGFTEVADSVNEEGLARFTADLEAGYWIVLVTGTVDEVYNPMLVGVYYSVGGSDNTMIPGSVDANTDWSLVTEGAYAKSTKPSIDKVVETPSDTGNDSGEAVAIGDTVEFSIATAIPSYSEQYDEVEVIISDELSSGLTLKPESIVVTGVPEASYTLETTEQGFKLSIDSAYALANGKQDITITYSATLNENAGINFDENTNTATLKYTNNPDRTTKEVKDKTYTYTFGIDASLNGSEIEKTKELFKVNETGKVEVVEKEVTVTGPLAGATFELTLNGTDKVYTATSDENGALEFKGLDEGTYTLVETKAPAGYTVNNTPHEVVISATYNNDGTLNSYTITIDDEATSTYVDTKEGPEKEISKTSIGSTGIVNTKISALPSTGGIGTTIFTIGGCIIMILAAALFFVNRRRSAE